MEKGAVSSDSMAAAKRASLRAFSHSLYFPRACLSFGCFLHTVLKSFRANCSQPASQGRRAMQAPVSDPDACDVVTVRPFSVRHPSWPLG